MNPADLSSRGLTGEKMLKNILWREDPSFLCLPDSEWSCEVMSAIDHAVNNTMKL